MKVRWYVAGMVLALGFAVASVGAREETDRNVSNDRRDRLVHQEIDRSTGAVVRVFKTNDGGRIEVEAERLKVIKAVAGQRVVTRISEPGDELVISLDAKTLAVTSKSGRVAAPRGDRNTAERARVLIAGSVVGRKAADLIGKMALGSSTPVQPMLLTTRLFVLAAAGDATGDRDMARWAREARARISPAARSVKVSFVEQEQDKDSSKGRTPGECWKEYSKEAIDAYVEYENCMNDKSWWDILGQAGCATVYDMRAIGAFSWWLKCVALS